LRWLFGKACRAKVIGRNAQQNEANLREASQVITFFIGLAILAVGYFTYGRVVEKLFGIDPARPTPAVENTALFEDRQALPHWKCMLIHLLHIAGVGPVVGVVLGAKFGPVVFLIIPLGNIFGGAVHDYFSGMISLRNGAGSYLEVSKKFLNKTFATLSTVFMIIDLFALAASFTNVSSGILNTNHVFSKTTSDKSFLLCICLIFSYYIFSTFFPISSFVSKLSNVFGIILVTSVVLVLFFISGHLPALPEFDIGNFLSNFVQHPMGHPILPMLFVTIACGMISGFHGSQNSITAGIESNEKNGRRTFYGMMVAEGFLAMIWAAVGVIGYSLYPHLTQINNGAVILSEIVRNLINVKFVSELILISVVILAITTADAALRVLRVLTSDAFHLRQKSAEDRFLLCIPILGVCAMIVFWSNITDGFSVLWNYFSLTNQTIAVICLAISVCYMRAKKKPVVFLLVPLAFLSFVIFLYLFWISPEHILNAPKGFGLGYPISCVMAFISSILVCFYSLRRGKHLAKQVEENKFNPDGH
jgi:carbon starvation protein CstA